MLTRRRRLVRGLPAMTRHRRAAVVILAIGAVLLQPVAGYADDGVAKVTCGQQPQPGCDLQAGAASHPRHSTTPPPAPASPQRDCANSTGQPQPCTDPELGWVGNDGCYYSPTTAPSTDTAPTGSGGWYQRTCTGSTGAATESLAGPVWLADSPPRPSDPVLDLAELATARLALPAPRLSTDPAPQAQLVGIPVWLWIADGLWRPQQATASAAGISVTATATPQRVAWSMGDGSTVDCPGPGTPWSPSPSASAESPDCGYTYRSASAGHPGGRFTLTVTVWWSITWSTPRRYGVLPALSTADSAAVTVAECQVLNSVPSLRSFPRGLLLGRTPPPRQGFVTMPHLTTVPASPSAAATRASAGWVWWRRHRVRLAVTLLLVLGGVAGSVMLVHATDSRQQVLVAAHAIPAGQRLTTVDLRVALLSIDTSLHPLPAARLGQVVGRPAALPLAAGTLLTAGDLGPARWPAAGQAMVAVAVKSGQYPPSLQPGASVTVLVTTAANTATGADTATPTVAPAATAQAPAVVVSVRAADSTATSTVVELLLANADAVLVATASTVGLIAVTPDR
jgi:hypothetical protein